MKRSVVIVFMATGLLASYHISLAQEIPQTGYPQDYFRDPLDLPIHLAGNYGELRQGHFHMGLDIKTNGRIGYPVFAAAEGFISHVKIESVGFGNAIYIDHPNGYSTVYVHLDRFSPELQQYVKQQQYALEEWSVFLDIPARLFEVKKGQFIAYSGNTGGSLAPHLHFEIRDTRTDQNRNPLLFGLPVIDKQPPSLLKLGVYDAHVSTYLQTPRLLTFIKAGDHYSIPSGSITVHTDQVRLAIDVHDKQSGSANLLGVYAASVSLDGQPISGFTLDGFGYDQTRYVDAHIDYSLKTAGGPYMEYLSALPGNFLPIYWSKTEDGLVTLTDDHPHMVTIVVKDGSGNRSEAKFTLRKAGPYPVYDQGGLFLPNQVNVFENDDFLMYLPEHCLYDNVRPVFQKKGEIYSLISDLIPSRDSFTVSIKPSAGIQFEEDSGYVILQKGAGKQHVSKVSWSKGWASGKFLDFGEFQLVRDRTPPDISPLGWSDGSSVAGRSALHLSVKDNLGVTRRFRAELDGKWLMFSLRDGVYTYLFDEHFPSGWHTLTVSVQDEAGNNTRSVYHLNR